MTRVARRPRFPRLHPVLAVLLAGAFHAALFLTLGRMAPRRIASVQLPELVGIELSFIEDRAIRSFEAPPAAARPLAARPSALEPRAAERAKRERTSGPASAVASRAQVPAASAENEPRAGGFPPGATPGAREGAASQGSIDLGLNGGIRRAAALGGWLEPERPRPAPSVGLLVEGLAQLDAERGVSRSSAAIHAGYEAARRAAPNGIGIFDLRTDERGVVLSVTLAGTPSEEPRWRRVGQELQELLKDRRLRVPAGASGLATRLRIERGELAQTLTERDGAKRGAALGQRELHSREPRDTSTRAHLDDPRQLSPTLGVSVAGAGGGGLIRVAVLDERAL